VKAALCALLFTCQIACGGGGNGTPPPSPSPSPSPSPGNQDPCASFRMEAADTAEPPVPAHEAERPGKLRSMDPSPQWRVLEALWIHRQALLRRGEVETLGPAKATSFDQGDIAVLRDQGDLIVPANAYDLVNLGLRFTRNADGGYDVRQGDAAFRTTVGNRVTLGDDDSIRVEVPFGFPFFGGTERTAFVNSDGNITFGEGDSASTDRSVGRLLTGPPRVAVFLSDLDPTTAGAVFVNAASDQYTVTWCGVRAFDSTRATTVQATLLPEGTVEMRFALGITVPDAVVGLSPGRTGSFRPIDLSGAGPTAGGGAAVGERFSEHPDLDAVTVTKTFYQSHPDSYDQLVMWTDANVVGADTFAFESTVTNEVRGIGLEIFDASREFGSAGRLRSYAVMDALTKYPDDPAQRFLGENTTLSVLGQECGHRWLAFVNFRDHRGERSDALLGRQEAHWSFFMDSDASVMEGNDIQDLGGGAFRTVDAVRRYSRLDQYAMGLVGPGDVPMFFYVESPTNLSETRDRESGPRIGVTFNGTRRDVLVDDIIAIHGARTPPAAESSRLHRQAFLYIVGGGRNPDAGQIAKVDRIRRQWETFFLQATENRMRADTRLAQ
jgi:hypothetical protein